MIVTKTVRQHSEKLPEETMKFLRGIAGDYAKVKTAVYERYSGIRGLEELYLPYPFRKEMYNCGLRQQLNFPSAYYEVAIAEAVSGIKTMWSILKNRIRKIIRENENLSDNERMYIRTILKYNKLFSAVLNRQSYEMSRNVQDVDIDTKKLNNLICRLVRRLRATPQVHDKLQFKSIPCGYSYRNGGIIVNAEIKST